MHSSTLLIIWDLSSNVSLDRGGIFAEDPQGSTEDELGCHQTKKTSEHQKRHRRERTHQIRE